MISTVILQNSARVRVPPGLKLVPPVPSTTPSRRSISAASAVRASAISVKPEVPAAEAGGSTSRPTTSAADSRPDRNRLNLIRMFSLYNIMYRSRPQEGCRGLLRPQGVHRLEAGGLDGGVQAEADAQGHREHERAHGDEHAGI